MTKDMDKAFVKEYKDFYKRYFSCIAESVSYLAHVQEKYSVQYQKILAFNENPQVLEELIINLPYEQQAILLRVLLKAGEFGRKFMNLMEMTPKEKKDFATDLKKFAEELEKM